MTAGWRLFGKLPAHGDFVTRGWSAEAAGELDAWLAASLAEARAGHGERFEERYDAAPPWRFAWPEAAGWTAGAIAPSVDRVGRRYPLLIAFAGVAAEGVEDTAAAAEALLYGALGEGWDADRIAAAPRAAGQRSDARTSGERWWTLGGGAHAASLSGARPPHLVSRMLFVQESAR